MCLHGGSFLWLYAHRCNKECGFRTQQTYASAKMDFHPFESDHIFAS